MVLLNRFVLLDRFLAIAVSPDFSIQVALHLELLDPWNEDGPCTAHGYSTRRQGRKARRRTVYGNTVAFFGRPHRQSAKCQMEEKSDTGRRESEKSQEITATTERGRTTTANRFTRRKRYMIAGYQKICNVHAGPRVNTVVGRQ
jgi:hypothetical protein